MYSDVSSKLVSFIEWVGSYSGGIKEAIVSKNCDAVANATGLASPTSLHKPGQLPEIFATVLNAAVDSGAR